MRFALILLVTCLSAFAQTIPATFRPGNKIFIEPMGENTELYISAAMLKKKVPLVIVTDENSADLILKAAATEAKPGWAGTIFLGRTKSNISISMLIIDRESRQVAWTCSAYKDQAFRGYRSAAEACTKLLAKELQGKGQSKSK